MWTGLCWLYLNRSFHCVATKRQQAEFSLPPSAFWARKCCGRHSGERCASTLAARFSRQAVGAWPITLGTRHQIHAFESQAVAEVPRTAEGGSRAPRSTAERNWFGALLEPTALHHLYTCTDSVVRLMLQVCTDSRDLKYLHGQMGSGRAGAQGAILHRREWNG